MTNYVMNPGRKRKRSGKARTRSKAKRTYRMTKKRRASLAKARRTYRMRYAKRYAKGQRRGVADTYLRRILCGKRSGRRIRRERKRLCGSGAPAASEHKDSIFPSIIQGMGGGGRASSPSFASSSAPSSVSLSDVDSPVGTNPRRSRFGYRGRNPMSALGSVTSAFSIEPLKVATPILGGMALANFGRRWVGGQSWSPAMIQSGKWGNLGIGVALSGVASLLIGRFMPKYSKMVLVGGVAEAIVGAVNNVLGRNVMSDCRGCQGLGCIGCGALLAGGTADGGVMLDQIRTEVPVVAQNGEMTSVDADVLDAFESEDVF